MITAKEFNEFKQLNEKLPHFGALFCSHFNIVDPILNVEPNIRRALSRIMRNYVEPDNRWVRSDDIAR